MRNEWDYLQTDDDGDDGDDDDEETKYTDFLRIYCKAFGTKQTAKLQRKLEIHYLWFLSRVW